MKNELKVFEYEGKSITFNLGNGDVMVNATEMAKPFGKTPWKWLELPSTKKFICAMSDFRSLAENELVISVRGGANVEERGNWFHEDVALEFARWLSPSFAIWCNDRIKELMKHGATAISPESLLDPDYVIRVMTALKEERAQKELERSQKEVAQAKLKEQAPDVKFANAVKKSESDCLIGSLAKMICQNGVEIGQKRLFQWMRDNGYLMRVGRAKNEPTQRSMNAELFRIIERRVELPSGDIIIKPTTMVTGKGQVYFINKFLKEEIEL